MPPNFEAPPTTKANKYYVVWHKLPLLGKLPSTANEIYISVPQKCTKAVLFT
jgi:hypothetical protein